MNQVIFPSTQESPETSEFTDDSFNKLIGRCATGCGEAQAELASLVHKDFYRIASRLCAGGSFFHSMHATNLLNETYLRLIKSGVFKNPRSSGFLFSAAGRTMRNVIADYLRRKNAVKRIPDRKSVYLDRMIDQLASSPQSFDDLHEALELLELESPRWAEVVNMRYFFAMTLDEIAVALDVSKSTVESDWRQARVWLYRKLQ